jgi:hypothetical protein
MGSWLKTKLPQKTYYILSSINKNISNLDTVAYILSSINKNISTLGRLIFFMLLITENEKCSFLDKS